MVGYDLRDCSEFVDILGSNDRNLAYGYSEPCELGYGNWCAGNDFGLPEKEPALQIIYSEPPLAPLPMSLPLPLVDNAALTRFLTFGGTSSNWVMSTA